MEGKERPTRKKASQDSQIFAMCDIEGESKLTRRHFLELAAASSAAATLTGCGSSEVGRDALATEIAAEIFATQTAEQPASSTSISTPVSTSTHTPIPTTYTPDPDIPQAMVDQPNVSLRAGPGFSYDAIITGLTVGATLYILARDNSGTWFRVRTEAGDTGWISNTEIRVEASFKSAIEAIPVAPDIPVKPTVRATPIAPPPPRPGGHYWYPN